MDFKKELASLGLDAENSVVIGSGVMSALGLRESKDIDITVAPAHYQKFARDPRFKKEEVFGREILSDGLFEVGTNWQVLGKNWDFEALKKESIVIDGVRYITPEFLLLVKKDWNRSKDGADVPLLEAYLQSTRA